MSTAARMRPASPDQPGDAPRRPIRPARTRARGLTALVLAGAVSGALATPVAHAAPPAAPAAPTAVPGAPGEPLPTDLPGLIRAVATATATLDAARGRLSGKRESVNKSLVDLQISRVQLGRATAEADRRHGEAERANTDVAQAKGVLDDYSRVLYQQGTAPGAAAEILRPGAPVDAARRQELLARAAADQRAVVARSEASRAAADRAAADADAAKTAADGRFAEASNRRDSAMADIASVSREVKDLQTQTDGLAARAAAAQRALDAARGPKPAAPAGPSGKTADIAAEKAAAQARLAANPQSARTASDVALALPSHLDLGAIAAGSSGPAGQAGRALAGTVTPGSTTAAITAAKNGDTDHLVQQVVDAIGRAAAGSSTAGPKAVPASPSTTAKAAPTTTSADDEEDDEGEDETTPAKPSQPKSTAPVSEQVRTVIDRAKSQLGLPYSWGGGDANGPTLGIHDGGVADSFGDYAKKGFDCSGLMIYAFAGVGIELAHFTGYQYTAGTQVPVDDMQPGDMLFWGPGGSEHVALYIGDGKMIEAPQSGDVVKISPVRMGGIEPNAVRMIE